MRRASPIGLTERSTPDSSLPLPSCFCSSFFFGCWAQVPDAHAQRQQCFLLHDARCPPHRGTAWQRSRALHVELILQSDAIDRCLPCRASCTAAAGEQAWRFSRVRQQYVCSPSTSADRDWPAGGPAAARPSAASSVAVVAACSCAPFPTYHRSLIV